MRKQNHSIAFPVSRGRSANPGEMLRKSLGTGFDFLILGILDHFRHFSLYETTPKWHSFFFDQTGRCSGQRQRSFTNFRHFFPFLCLLVTLGWAGDGSAEPARVTVTGVGFIAGGDTAAARDQAIRDAHIRALEQAMGIEIDAKTALHKSLLVDDTVITRTKGAVREYTILEEGRTGFGLYRVKMEAVVDRVAMADELLKEAGRRRILIIIPTRKNGPGNGCAVLLEILAPLFSEAGFSLSRAELPETDFRILDFQKTIDVSKRTGADLVVTLDLASEAPQCMTDNYCAGRAGGFVRIYSGRTGKMIAEEKASGIRGFGNTAALASGKAHAQAADALADGLMGQLMKPRSRRLKVAFKGVPDFETYRSLRNQILALRWVRQVREDTVGYHPLKSVFWVEYAQDPDMLAAMLDKLGGYRFAGRTGRVLTLEAGK